MSFDALKSQPKAVGILKSLFVGHRLPHALLFLGPENAGQREVAFWLAKVLFCQGKKDLDPCGTCFHCRQIEQNSHPDLIVLEPIEDSRFIKIEAIRELIGKANLKPFAAEAKLFVIDGAEAMNEEAQNALLKTLEEPEGRTYFILISSSPDQLLPTIRSRAQALHFLPVSADRELDPEEEILKEEVLRFVLSGSDEGGAPPDLSKVERQAIARIFDFLMEYFRQLLLLRVGAKEIVGPAADLGQKEKLAAALDEGSIAEKIELLSEFKEKILANTNIKLTQSVLWDELKDAKLNIK